MKHIISLNMAAIIAVLFMLGCGAPALPTVGQGLGGGAVVLQAPAASLDRPDPWLLEWGGDERSALVSQLNRGVVLVKYTDGVLEMIPDCQMAGAYEGSNVQSRPVEEKTLSSSMDLRAKLGIQLVHVKGAFEKGESWSLKYTVAEVKRASINGVSRNDVPKICASATHFVDRVFYGAFILDTGAFREGSAGVEVPSGADISATTGGKATLMRSDGDYQKCQNPSLPKTDVACCGVLKIGLAPILE